MWHSHSYVTWLIHMWHACINQRLIRAGHDSVHMGHDSFIHMRHDSFICDMTHPSYSDTTHAYLTYETWLMHIRQRKYECVIPMCDSDVIRPHDMSHVVYEWVMSHANKSCTRRNHWSCAWHDSFICETWLIHTWDTTHPYVWQDLMIWVGYISSLLKMIGLFCKRDLWKRWNSATYVWHT